MAKAPPRSHRESAAGLDPRHVVASLLALTFLLGLSGVVPQVQAAVPGTPPYAWSVERVVTDGDTGWYTSIALDALGHPFIAYVDGTNGTVNVAHQVNGTWTSERVDGPGSFAGDTSIAIAPNGTVQLSYYDQGTLSVKYARKVPTGWSTVVIDTGLPDGFNRLILDSSGRPAVVYVSYQAWVRYALWNGTGWALETVDDTSILPRYVDVALDASNRPRVTYYANGILRYATKANGVWARQVVDASSGAGWFSRVSVDRQGLASVAYYDSVNRTLRWATNLNGKWTHTVLDGSGDSGWDISVSTDASGHAQIAYYARLTGSLRFAVNTTIGWVFETVDEGGVVGWYSGIATDAAGLPHISYYDWTNGDLKYAVGRIALQARTVGVVGTTPSAATLQGELVALGTHTFADVGFAYRTAGTANWSSVPVRSFSAAGVFSAAIADLTPGVTYEFRAEARAANETSLGVVLTFRAPLPAAPPPPYLEVAGSAGAIAAVIGIAAVYLRTRRKRRTYGNAR